MNKKIMYVSDIQNHKGEEVVIVHINDKQYILRGKSYKTYSNYVDVIKIIAEKEDVEIYIDVNGFGIALYEELLKFENLSINKLNIKRDYILD